MTIQFSDKARKTFDTTLANQTDIDESVSAAREAVSGLTETTSLVQPEAQISGAFERFQDFGAKGTLAKAVFKAALSEDASSPVAGMASTQSSPTPTTFHVSTSAELMTAIDNATGGDTILLAAGNYDGFTYSAYGRTDWGDGQITITSADPDNLATFTNRVKMGYVSQLSIENIRLDADENAEFSHQPWLNIFAGESIELRDIDIIGELVPAGIGMKPLDKDTTRNDLIDGYPYNTGLTLTNLSDVTVENVTLSDVRTGIFLKGLSNTVLDNVEIHDMREGINFSDVMDLTIQNSYFHSFNAWLPLGHAQFNPTVHDHPDFIQYFGDGGNLDWMGEGANVGILNVNILNNRFELAAGEAAQVIFGHTDRSPEGYTAENFTITGNTIINGHPNSIRIADVDGGLVENNVLVPNKSDLALADAPLISLRTDGQNIHVGANAWVTNDHRMLLGYDTVEELVAAGNTVDPQFSLSVDASADNYWGNFTVEQLHTMLAQNDFADYEHALAIPLVLSGGFDDDVLNGDIEDDEILLRFGDDIATGFAGADDFILDSRYLADGDAHTITDINFDEGDVLILRFLDEGNAVAQDVYQLLDLQDRADISVGVNGDDFVVTMTGVDFGTVTLTLQDDAWINDVPGVNLFGGSGDEALSGTRLDDTLLARFGNDTMTGFGGADTFIVDARYIEGGETHVIVDLNFDASSGASDRLELRFFDANTLAVDTVAELLALDSRADMTLVETGQDLRIDIDGQSFGTMSVLLVGGAAFLEGGSTATPVGVTLSGGAGDDTLVGTTVEDSLLARYGNDTLTGGTGADEFILDGRYMSEGDAHVITDLSFSEGDVLKFRFLDNGAITAADMASFLALDDHADISVTSVGADYQIDIVTAGVSMSALVLDLA